MDGVLTLLLDHRETLVTLDGKALRVEQPQAPAQLYPLGLIGLVVVHGAPMVSCEVWRALAERGVAAVLFPSRGQGEPAWLGSGLSASLSWRITQHRLAAQDSSCLAIARWVVARKVQAHATLLADLLAGRYPFDWTRGEAFLTAGRGTLAELTERIRQLAAAADLDTLRGREGAAAEVWFRFLVKVLPERWGFRGRNRRPPRDPFNAMISLIYTLIMAEVACAVHAKGLDPALGFLHAPEPGRFSLVLDLLEPFRAGADLLALSLLDNELVTGHFTLGERDGCRLNQEGRRGFYKVWGEARLAWPGNTPWGMGKPLPVLADHGVAELLALPLWREGDHGPTP